MRLARGQWQIGASVSGVVVSLENVAVVFHIALYFQIQTENIIIIY